MDIGKSAGKSVSFTAPESSDLVDAYEQNRNRGTDSGNKRAREGQGQSISGKRRKLEGLVEKIDQSLRDRDIDQRNIDLKNSRTDSELSSALKRADSDMNWYNEIESRMASENSSLEELSGKNSDEIHEFLLENKIITIGMSKDIKKDDVDLEGSPYW